MYYLPRLHSSILQHIYCPENRVVDEENVLNQCFNERKEEGKVNVMANCVLAKKSLSSVGYLNRLAN